MQLKSVLIVSVVIAAAAAVGYGVGPLPLLLVVGGGLGLVLSAALLRPDSSSRSEESALEESPERGWLGSMTGYVWAGLALRLVGAVVVNATPLWLSFGPDSMTWERYGQQMLSSWSNPSRYGPSLSEVLGGQLFFPGLNAIAIALFGSARYPVSLLNAFGGVACAIAGGRLTYELYGAQAAKRTLLLILFYPSLILWSTMNIREVWAHLGILLVLIAGHNVRRRLAPLSMLVLLASLLLVYFSRPYLLSLLGVSVVGSLLVVRVRQLPYALTTLVILGLLAQQYGDVLGVRQTLLTEESLETIQDLRTGLAYGGSAYGADVDTSSFTKALLYLPQGVVTFLFAPFPWSVRSWQQALAAPESMAFFVVFVLAMQQVIKDLRRNASEVILPLLTIVSLTCAYGLVSGNEGTAFRHRAQIAVVVFVFSGARMVGRARERKLGRAQPDPRASTLSVPSKS